MTVESELDLLLGRAIDSLVKLELLLHFHEGSGLLQTPADISARLRRPLREVVSALEELAQVDLVARFALGSGKHVIYGSSEDPHVQALLDALQERYQGDAASRAKIIADTLRSDGDADPGSSAPS